jgi:DNA-binding transcriptional ArsR family regulator
MLSAGNRVEVFKIIAHPVRIKILEELRKGVKCVSDFEEFLDIRQPNVSQHLTLMRRCGLIDFFIDGRLKCYFLVDPLIPDILEVLHKSYSEELPAPACCPITKKGKYPGTRKQEIWIGENVAMTIILYLNDPPGKRWTNIQSVVTELFRKYTFDVKIIKKSEMSFRSRRLLNIFPSVAINDTIVFKGRDVSIAEFKSAIIQEMGRTEHLP